MGENRDMHNGSGDSAVEIIDLSRGADDFASDVIAGLTANPKTLSPRYFYDDLGSVLFDAICRLSEYYVARAEDEILRGCSDEIVATLSGQIRLVELGSGTAAKTRHLIDATLRSQPELHYVPIDIDGTTLRTTTDALSAEYHAMTITAIAASFEDGLKALEKRPSPAGQRTLVLFLGSSIGNLDPQSQRDVLRLVRAVLRTGDALLVGTDLVKETAVLIPAYDDVLGVTAAFNRNLLVRINREIGGTLNVAAFRHEARYDPVLQRIEMHLVSTAEQRATVGPAGTEIHFGAGESIHTESSYKFTYETVDLLARQSQFSLVRQWTDRRRWFGANLLIAV